MVAALGSTFFLRDLHEILADEQHRERTTRWCEATALAARQGLGAITLEHEVRLLDEDLHDALQERHLERILHGLDFRSNEVRTKHDRNVPAESRSCSMSFVLSREREREREPEYIRDSHLVHSRVHLDRS